MSKITILAGAAMLILALSSLAQAQQRFNTPEAGAEALVAAARKGDGKAIVSILGPGSEELVSSGDPVADANRRQEYLAAYDAGHRIVTEAGKGATLIVGPNDWPFPIPMVQRDGQWIFDVAAGREEILARRIGENELATMKALLAYWDAQNEYADMYFALVVKKGALGKFVHLRELPIDSIVVRPNRDTLYSEAVFDLDAGPVRITLPKAGNRFMIGLPRMSIAFSMRISTPMPVSAPA